MEMVTENGYREGLLQKRNKSPCEVVSPRGAVLEELLPDVKGNLQAWRKTRRELRDRHPTFMVQNMPGAGTKSAVEGPVLSEADIESGNFDAASEGEG